MKTSSLTDFFSRIEYNWYKDKESLEEICSLTKTRTDTNSAKFNFAYGMEQPFLIKSVAEHINACNFFEIGTGRGTASYSVSLIPGISEITTVDIVPFDEKLNTAIHYKPAFVSNKDIFEMISSPEKEKINFKHTSDYSSITTFNPNSYDLCFIDGCHEDSNVILNDFDICLKLIKDGGYIVWDDYTPHEFEVKQVVDSISSKYNYDCELIEFRGHLFGGNSPEKNACEVLMKITK